MNQEQRKYFLDRIHGMLRDEEQKLKERHTKPAREISSHERAKLIRTNKVKLKSDVDALDNYARIKEVFDFSAYEYEETLDEKKFRSEMKPRLAHANFIRDRLMFSEAQDIVAMIERFEAEFKH